MERIILGGTIQQPTGPAKIAYTPQPCWIMHVSLALSLLLRTSANAAFSMRDWVRLVGAREEAFTKSPTSVIPAKAGIQSPMLQSQL